MLVLEMKSTANLAVTVAFVAATVAFIYGLQVWARSRSRSGHTDAPATGFGTWNGRVEVLAVRLFQAAEIGAAKSLLLSTGVPVRVDLSPTGVRVSMTSVYLRKQPGILLDAPWSDVVDAVPVKVGLHHFGHSYSTVPMTDVNLTIVGQSAIPFVAYLGWGAASSNTTEITQDEAARRAFISETLGPHWRTGTALLTVRTSAPEYLAESISRYACGMVPS